MTRRVNDSERILCADNFITARFPHILCNHTLTPTDAPSPTPSTLSRPQPAAKALPSAVAGRPKYRSGARQRVCEG